LKKLKTFIKINKIGVILLKVIVSGTPGVGKHTISIELSRMLNGIPILDINKVILSENLLIPSSSSSSSSSSSYGNEVNIEKTFNSLKLILTTKEYDDAVIVGHLAPYVVDPVLVDFIIVLRRSPYELKKIYEIRSYSKKKIYDNVVSEILGIISYDFLKKFNKKDISEIEINENILPCVSAQKIIDMYANKNLREFGIIDWLPLIQSDPQMVKFLM
jgi:adenylate kinase